MPPEKEGIKTLSLIKPKTNGKPPSIIINHRNYIHKELLKIYADNTQQNFTIKYNRNSTVILTSNNEDYKSIMNILTTNDARFYTYTPKTEKQHGFVLKGLQDYPQMKEIEKELRNYGLPIHQIYKMKNITNNNYIVITENTITLQHLKEKSNTFRTLSSDGNDMKTKEQ